MHGLCKIFFEEYRLQWHKVRIFLFNLKEKTNRCDFFSQSYSIFKLPLHFLHILPALPDASRPDCWMDFAHFYVCADLYLIMNHRLRDLTIQSVNLRDLSQALVQMTFRRKKLRPALKVQLYTNVIF